MTTDYCDETRLYWVMGWEAEISGTNGNSKRGCTFYISQDKLMRFADDLIWVVRDRKEFGSTMRFEAEQPEK